MDEDIEYDELSEVEDVDDDLDEDLDDDIENVIDDDEIDQDELDKELIDEQNQLLTDEYKSFKQNIIVDDEEYNDSSKFLQKFNNDIKNDYILEYHHECLSKNYDEIKILTKITRDKNNIIIDNLHKTIPILTKYEKTRILGIRTKQLNNGAKPFINIAENIIDNYYIANLELEQKKLPFIIERPLPNNLFEYWKLKDLELI